jgi:hypothetical protein
MSTLPTSPRRPVVYVAGPISKGDLPLNVMRANAAGLALLKAGLAPVVPHGSCFWGNKAIWDDASIGLSPEALPAGTTHEEWVGADIEIVRRCDAVLRLPGESAGADREVEAAIWHGLPVFHSLQSVLRWHAIRGDE